MGLGHVCTHENAYMCMKASLVTKDLVYIRRVAYIGKKIKRTKLSIMPSNF